MEISFFILYFDSLNLKQIKMKTQTISVKSLIEVLKNVQRGSFAHIIIMTEPKMRKTDNPFFGHIKKVTNGNILIGGD